MTKTALRTDSDQFEVSGEDLWKVPTSWRGRASSDVDSIFRHHLADSRQMIWTELAWLAARQSRSWSITSSVFDIGALTSSDISPVAATTASQALRRLAVQLLEQLNDPVAWRPNPEQHAALPAHIPNADVTAARMRQLEWLKGGGLKDLADPEQRGQVWR